MDATEELAVEADGPRMVCTLKPGRSRTADEAVGFVLLPVLVASVLATLAYVLVYVSVAVLGSDPAIALVPWRSAFFGLAAVAWLAASVWQWTQVPHGGSQRTELRMDVDSITLLAQGAVGFYVLLRDIRDAAVIQDGVQIVQILRDGEAPLRVAMGGNSPEAADWLAQTVRARAAELRRGLEPGGAA